MAAESITQENIEAFRNKVAEFRNDANGKSLRPGDIALMAARNLGIGSAVLPLSYAGMRMAADCEGADLEDVRFWIAASVGVSLCAGGFAKEWLDAFNEQFFDKVSGVRDLPSPYGLKLPKEMAKPFKLLLQCAVAYAENKGKVGKTAINKCLGFRCVKYWSESEGWCSDGGFTDDDRALLKSLAAQGGESRSPGEVGVASVPSGEVGEMKNRLEAIQLRLNEEQRKSYQLGAQLDSAQKECAHQKDGLKAVQTERDALSENVSELQEQKEKLEAELSECRAEILQKSAECQRLCDEAQRRNALADNHAKARSDAIAEVVSPIRRQIEDANGRPMSVEMGGVLLTHINRIIATLKENGFEV